MLASSRLSCSRPGLAPRIAAAASAIETGPDQRGKRDLTDEDIRNDLDFWDWYTRRLTGDRRFVRDVVARKSFSKLRSAIAGLYAARRRLGHVDTHLGGVGRRNPLVGVLRDDVGHLVPDDRGQLVLIPGGPEDPLVHADLVPGKGEGIHRIVIENEDLPAGPPLIRREAGRDGLGYAANDCDGLTVPGKRGLGLDLREGLLTHLPHIPFRHEGQL